MFYPFFGIFFKIHLHMHSDVLLPPPRRISFTLAGLSSTNFFLCKIIQKGMMDFDEILENVDNGTSNR